MGKKLDLKEILRQEVDEIINQLRVEEYSRKQIETVKRLLKGFFKDKENKITVNHEFSVDGFDLYISTVRHSEGRVFFKFQKGANQKFSLSRDYLTGREIEFPYKPGDKCVYGNDICEVVSTNPASQKMTISIEGNKKKVSIKKVTKFYEEA
jgi:hypothetical protein